MTRDWVRWHSAYDDGTSALSRRLEVVRRDLRRALAEAPADHDGTQRVVSMCAGDGRDILPVLAEQDDPHRIRALLVELDPTLSGRARSTARDLRLKGVEVRTTDAGTIDAYPEGVPAHIVLACGVFGNISFADARRTIDALPSLMTAGGFVIWTRGTKDGLDPSIGIRESLRTSGFHEVSFTAPAHDGFRVGMSRLEAEPDARRRPHRGTRLFTFVQ